MFPTPGFVYAPAASQKVNINGISGRITPPSPSSRLSSASPPSSTSPLSSPISAYEQLSALSQRHPGRLVIQFSFAALDTNPTDDLEEEEQAESDSKLDQAAEDSKSTVSTSSSSGSSNGSTASGSMSPSRRRPNTHGHGHGRAQSLGQCRWACACAVNGVARSMAANRTSRREAREIAAEGALAYLREIGYNS